jgi:hypothetical protein
MEIYQQALFLDLTVLVVCAYLLLRHGNLTFSHPAIPYLVFHVYVVTLRLVALLFGDASTLFSKWQGPFDAVLPQEIARAASYFDIALATMTLTWLWLRRQPAAGPRRTELRLDPSRVWAVIVGAFLCGVAALAIGAQLPGFQPNQRAADLGDWGSSSYLVVAQTWCGLALLAHIYCYGFKRRTLFVLAVYLLVMIFQGYHRFRVVIPVLMLAQVYLDRRQLRWPPRWMVGGFLIVAILFFPLKTIGRMWQTGSSLEEIGSVVSESTERVMAGEADDQMFLDQLASALTLIDMNGRLYWGRPYLALLTLPIPRQWWPEKPSAGEYMADISIPSRPMRENGMIMTFLGEAYANYGLLGVILIPPLLAMFLTWLYRKAYRSDYHSVLRFTYVLISVTLIQVYRDGLTSLVMFTFVNALPLMVIVLLHLMPGLTTPSMRPALGPRPPLGS